MSIKSPIILISIILLSSSLNVACSHRTKHKSITSCHTHKDNAQRRSNRHCHAYPNRNGLQHEHNYRHRNL
jgi:hypothetical protein